VTTTKTDIDSAREQAALCALGALPADEARALGEQLAEGDAAVRDELAAFRSVVDDLAYAAPAQAPPSALRARVLGRIAATEPVVIEQDDVRFVRGAQVDWEAGPIAGLQLKRLSMDGARGRRTSLVRMAAGVGYPRHRHADVEELYLLEGELLISGVLMRPGDYCRAEPDSVHDGIVTPGGCLFIVIACERDELLP